MADQLSNLFRDKRSQTLLFAVFVATLIAIRFVVFASDGAPPTIDGGNWLAFGDSILGGDARDASISYPPVVPLLAKGFVWVFGLTVGISMLAAVSATVPSIGVFVTLGSSGLGRARLFPAVILLGVGSVGEAASWGGFPQLIGMGLLPLAVLSAHRLFDQPIWTNAVRAGLATMAVLAVSHFVAAVLVLAVGVLFVMHALEKRSRQWVLSAVRLSPLVLVFSLWLIPVYADLVTAVVVNPNEFADLDNLTASNFFDRLEGIYADAPFLWRLLIPMTVIAPFLRWSVGRSTLVWVLRALFISLAIMLIVSREGRYLYLLPTLAVLSIALWIKEAVRRVERDRQGFTFERKVAVAALAVLAMFAQMYAGLRTLDDQRYFYTAVSPPLVEAIELAGEASSPGDVIAVPSMRSAPIGWWVEALTERTVLYGSALRWLNFEDEVARAEKANAIFTPDFPNDASLDLLEASDVDLILMPRTWQWYRDDVIAAWVTENDLRVLLMNGDALVVEVG